MTLLVAEDLEARVSGAWPIETGLLLSTHSMLSTPSHYREKSVRTRDV
jgi:hypothetical protein